EGNLHYGLWIDDHRNLHKRLYRTNYGRDVVLNTQAGKIQVRRVVVPDDPHDLVYDIEFVLANGQEVEIQMNGPGTKVLCPCCSVRNGYAAFIVQVDIYKGEIGWRNVDSDVVVTIRTVAVLQPTNETVRIVNTNCLRNLSYTSVRVGKRQRDVVCTYVSCVREELVGRAVDTVAAEYSGSTSATVNGKRKVHRRTVDAVGICVLIVHNVEVGWICSRIDCYRNKVDVGLPIRVCNCNHVDSIFFRCDDRVACLAEKSRWVGCPDNAVIARTARSRWASSKNEAVAFTNLRSGWASIRHNGLGHAAYRCDGA